MSYSTTDQLDDTDFMKGKLPSGLNVLTILSYIGCAIQLIGTGYGYISAAKSYNDLDKNMAAMTNPDAPAFVKGMIGDPQTFRDIVTKSYENRLPIMLMGLVATILCFVGVMQMRKLQKSGYMFYVIGELLPILSTFLFIGAFAFTGSMMWFGIGIAILFIILYTMQRKHLIY